MIDGVTVRMSRAEDGSDEPQAVIHKRILDVAEANPDASLEAIAEEVSGSSIELVGRVLERYGDPSADQADGSAGDEEETESESTTDEEVGGTDPEAGDGADDVPAHPQLSEDRTEMLRLILRDPDATQRELAERLDVTAATISRWLNDIPGFDWTEREAFAERLLGATDDGDPASAVRDEDAPAARSDGAAESREGGDGSDRGTTRTVEDDRTGEHEGDDRTGGSEEDGLSGEGEDVAEGDGIEGLRRRVAALETRIDGAGDGPGEDRIDADLLHGAMAALRASERISEAEEVRILDRLLD
jgi:transcriptional regulator with XRE-family HTH domain